MVFPSSDIIQLINLTKTFREGSKQLCVLNKVNLTLRRGGIYILLGRSGSGKSTILNLLSGIDLPTDGQVIINGADLTEMNEQGRTLFRRKHIGFVFQFFNLIPTLTVEENLLLPLELNGRHGRNERQLVRDLLAKVGLEDRAGSFPDRLSGGEQQRVAIARAIIHEPDIILADEPTGNLDFETGLHVIDLLDKLVRENGTTMIMATHSRDVIGLADKIFRVHEGKLHEISGEEIR
jgi:putative ABC transport system ATP-binding protein